jgi:protein-S-isoprenylcysteine O-methyltransferase Ste14
MLEKTGITLLITLFLAGFIARTLLIKSKVKKPIRSKDALNKIAIIFTSILFTIGILSVFSERLYDLMLSLNCIRSISSSILGLIFFAAGLILGWASSANMGESWRVGVIEDQKTELITNGIYGHIRNPYFLSYYIIFLSLFLIRPSVLIGMSTMFLVFVFHMMVIKEEKHLEKLHGNRYLRYKKKTGMYFPIIFHR